MAKTILKSKGPKSTTTITEEAKRTAILVL
jgi:hypothetical protein